MTFGTRRFARTATLAACLALLLGMGCASGLGGGNRVVDGLKQALSIGTQNAVTKTSQLGGYLDDPAGEKELR